MVLGGFLVLLLSVIEGNDWVQILSELIAILGVELLVVELHQARQLLQSEQLIKLNADFNGNDDYRVVYSALEKYDFENSPDLELDSMSIASYISFFEALQVLIERGAVSLEMINDLFGYRFFIMAHNPYIQKRFLLGESRNYKTIFILEKNWMKYRRENGYSIFHEEMELSRVLPEAEYKELVSYDD